MNSVYSPDGHTFDKVAFGSDIKKRLASHRDVFVIDEDDWLVPDGVGKSATTMAIVDGGPSGPKYRDAATKHVSRAALKLLLDYCTEDWPNMSIVEYAAAVFHSRQPEPGETLFSLLPEVEKRLDAARLGLSHIYSK